MRHDRISRTALAALAIAALAVAMAACGIPSEKSANRVADDRVPYRLLDEDNRGVSPSDRLGSDDAVIYLVRGGRLIPTTRPLTPPLTVPRLLRSLGRGPTNEEVASGIGTALPPEDTPSTGHVERGEATIDLPESFTALTRADQVLALAQIVYTVTERPGIGQVRFTLDGTITDIPRADRSLTSEPLTREDYLALAPLS